MRKNILLFCILFVSIVANAQYKVSIEGNAFVEKTVHSTISIADIKQVLNDILSENAIYGGRILSADINSIKAQYILKTIKKAVPISIDANSIIDIKKENDSINVAITLYDYQKYTSFGNTGVSIPIKDTKPLNPKGKKFGFSSGQIKDAFSQSIIRINNLLNSIEVKLKVE